MFRKISANPIEFVYAMSRISTVEIVSLFFLVTLDVLNISKLNGTWHKLESLCYLVHGPWPCHVHDLEVSEPRLKIFCQLLFNCPIDLGVNLIMGKTTFNNTKLIVDDYHNYNPKDQSWEKMMTSILNLYKTLGIEALDNIETKGCCFPTSRVRIVFL